MIDKRLKNNISHHTSITTNFLNDVRIQSFFFQAFEVLSFITIYYLHTKIVEKRTTIKKANI